MKLKELELKLKKKSRKNLSKIEIWVCLKKIKSILKNVITEYRKEAD
jgi:hypothetical protein